MPTGHAQATVGDTVLAETDTWEEVEGNVYFPPGSVKTDYLSRTDHSTHCPWKGDASYYSIHVDGKELENAAWYYAQTKDKAQHIRNHVAFCRRGGGVKRTWPFRVRCGKRFGYRLTLYRGTSDKSKVTVTKS